MLCVYVAFCEGNKEEMHEKGIFLRDTVLKSLFPAYSPDKITIINEGKPVLKDFPGCFSLSHSKGGVAFAVGGDFRSFPEIENTISLLIDEAPTEIGVDIESVSREINFQSVIKDIFSPSECDYVGDSKEKFIEIFTKKESLCKLDGNGIRNLKKYDVFNLCDALNVYTQQISSPTDTYFVSISYKE